MPFPPDLESLIAAAYIFARCEQCAECGETVEIFVTPGKRTIAMQPMCEALRPAVRHCEVCNIAPKQEESNVHDNASARTREPSGQDGHGRSTSDCQLDAGQVGHIPGDGQTVLRDGRRDDEGQGTKSRGVETQSGAVGPQKTAFLMFPTRGHNVIQVGWRDGVLRVAFAAKDGPRFGRYAGVPEAEFEKLRKVPFPDKIFTHVIKGKFTYTKED